MVSFLHLLIPLALARGGRLVHGPCGMCSLTSPISSLRDLTTTPPHQPHPSHNPTSTTHHLPSPQTTSLHSTIHPIMPGKGHSFHREAMAGVHSKPKQEIRRVASNVSAAKSTSRVMQGVRAGPSDAIPKIIVTPVETTDIERYDVQKRSHDNEESVNHDGNNGGVHTVRHCHGTASQYPDVSHSRPRSSPTRATT